MSLTIFVSANTESRVGPSWQTYYLIRDCKEPSANGTKTRHEALQHLQQAPWMQKRIPDLQVDLSLGGAAVIELLPALSSPGNIGLLTCEVFIKSPPGFMIMLQIQNLFIPTPSSSEDLCDENYLYLFDSNTPQSRAMPEAGGEKGLCQEVNELGPIFSSGSYLTAVFRSSLAPVNNRRPSFKFLLTAIALTLKDGSCPSTAEVKGDLFKCDNNPTDSTSTASIAMNSHNSGRPRDVEREKTYRQMSFPSYCIYRELLCDNVFHCHTGSDELPLARFCKSDENIVSNFLQLGVHASIGIAVCSILFFIALFGLCVCCCYRCCHTRHKPPSSAPTLSPNTANSQFYLFCPPNSTPAGSGCSYPYQQNQSAFVMVPNSDTSALMSAGSNQDNYFQLVPSQAGGSDCSWATSPSGVLLSAQGGPHTYTESSVLTANGSTNTAPSVLPQQLQQPGCVIMGNPSTAQAPLGAGALQPSSNFSALQTLQPSHVVGGQFYQISPSPYFSIANPDKMSDNASRTSSQSSGLAGRSNQSRGYPAPQYMPQTSAPPGYAFNTALPHQPTKAHKSNKKFSQNGGGSQKSSSRRNTSPSFSSHSSAALTSQGQLNVQQPPSLHGHYPHPAHLYNANSGQQFHLENISHDHHDPSNIQCLMQL